MANNGTAKLSDLTPDDRNANKGTQRGTGVIEDSLRKYGAGRSILIDRNGKIIAGNKTAEAAASIGLENVRIIETDGHEIVAVKRTDLDLDSKEARELAIADNRAGELNLDWDVDALTALEAEGVDLDGLFYEDELQALIDATTPDEPKPAPEPQLDRAEELREQWGTERGQVWQVGKHRLMCGDSTSADDVARLMDGASVALVITDPPYGVGYADKNAYLNAISRGNCIQEPITGDHGDKEQTQALWRAAFHEMAEVMAPGAVVYCFMPQGGDQMMMMMMMMMGAGIEPRHELIWLKNNHVLGRVDYAYKHEPILYAWKEGGHKFYGDFQTSVLEYPKPQSSDMHPTTKPVELIAHLTENSSKRGASVYDPFLGSGTTMVAAEQLGRVGYGMEIEPKYVAVALQRMADMGLTPEQV